MATIDGIRRTAASTGTAARSRATPDGEATHVDTSRALTVVQPAARVVPPTISSNRTAAGFLAHLIAIEQQAPQTRLRRRAEPAQASLAYRTTLGLATRSRPLFLTKTC